MKHITFALITFIMIANGNMFAQDDIFDQDSYKLERYQSDIYQALSTKDNIAERNKKQNILIEFTFDRYVRKWNPEWFKRLFGSKYKLTKSQVDYMIIQGKFMCQNAKAIQAIGPFERVDGTAIADDLEKILKAAEDRSNSYEDFMERNKDKYN